uniref:Uncharacterized protein n=1 Tax=Kalanchoe fedtschenkoi TaxID=63787 RepID=A0A7N0RIQ5_KALFE
MTSNISLLNRRLLIYTAFILLLSSGVAGRIRFISAASFSTRSPSPKRYSKAAAGKHAEIAGFGLKEANEQDEGFVVVEKRRIPTGSNPLHN